MHIYVGRSGHVVEGLRLVFDDDNTAESNSANTRKSNRHAVSGHQAC